MSARRTLALALAAALLVACHVRIAEFTVAGITADPEPPAVAPPQRTTGTSCRWWVLGTTIGLPRIEEAVADALARAGASGPLRHVTLDSVHPVYGPVGRHCYVVSGTASTGPR